jgi:hypothetical protein
VLWYNVSTQYGGDKTGAADSTTAIQNAITAAGAAGGGIVYLPSGSYKISVQLSMTNLTGVTVMGDAQSTFIKPTSGLSGGTVFRVAGGNANSVRDLMIQFPSTTTSSNPVCNSVNVAHSTNFGVSNVEVLYGNGYAVIVVTDSTGDSLYPTIDRVHSYACNGGVLLQGTGSVDNLMNALISDCKFENCQTLPGIYILDTIGVQITNITGGGNLNTMIIIGGLSSGIDISNSNCGAASTSGASLLIQPSSGNNPFNITVSNSIIQKGSYPLEVTGGRQISFSNCIFQQGNTYGALFQNVPDQVLFSNCIFASNGLTAGAANRDIFWGSTANITIIGCSFNTPIGTGAGQVATSTDLHYGTTTVIGCFFVGGAGTAFATQPTYAASNNGDALSNFRDLLANDMYFTEQAALPAARGAADIMYADNKSRPTWWANGQAAAQIWNLDRSQTDAASYVANTQSALPLSKAYNVDVNGNQLASAYLLKIWVNGTWGTALNLWCNLGGTVTHLSTCAAVFASAVVAGDAVAGWMELMVMPINSSNARVEIIGSMTDMTASGSGSSASNTASFSGQVGNLAFAGGVIGIQASWAGANAAQTIQSVASTFTRRG